MAIISHLENFPEKSHTAPWEDVSYANVQLKVMERGFARNCGD